MLRLIVIGRIVAAPVMEAHGAGLFETNSRGGYHDGTLRKGKETQHTTHHFRSPADHGNDVRHGKGSYGTNKRIGSCEEYRSCPRRLCGRVRLGGRLQSPEEGRL